MNKRRIRITGFRTDVPAEQLLGRLCLLRSARKVGDTETVNNTQLGRLRQYDVSFEIEE